MQGDGNFVIYPGTSMQDFRPAVWDSGGHTGQDFIVQLHDDGVLAIHSGHYQQIRWATIRSTLITYEALRTDEVLTSPAKLYYAYLHRDGRIAIYAGSGPDNPQECIWVSGEPNPERDYFAIMQGDGNFCIYPGPSFDQRAGNAVWWTKGKGPSLFGRAISGARPQGDYFVRMEDDGNLAVYAGFRKKRECVYGLQVQQQQVLLKVLICQSTA